MSVYSAWCERMQAESEIGDAVGTNAIGNKVTAQSTLRNAARLIDERAAERDKDDGERTMAGTVRAFNALTGFHLSETQGWLFMALLKIARSQGGAYKADDYEDMAAYAALAAESEAAIQVEYNDGRAIGICCTNPERVGD